MLTSRFSTFLLAAFLLLLSSSIAVAQNLELGVKGGISVYSGDLSPSQFGIFFEDLNFAGGVYLRYRPTTRFGVRINGNFGRLDAQRDRVFRNENNQRVEVPFEFETTFSEFNLVGEFDLFYLGDPEGNFLAPYAYAGVGVFSFNPKATDRDGNLVELQPLRTEGQGLDNTRYAPAPYELTRVVGIIGGGVRVRFAERFVVGLELGGRFTGTDYIDDIGSVQVNYNDILRSNNGATAAFFSNPAVQNPAEVDNLEYRRGGDFNDYYFVGGLTFGITLGEGGRGKGCYSF